MSKEASIDCYLIFANNDTNIDSKIGRAEFFSWGATAAPLMQTTKAPKQHFSYLYLKFFLLFYFFHTE